MLRNILSYYVLYHFYDVLQGKNFFVLCMKNKTKNFVIKICGEFLFAENLLEDNVKLRSRIKKCMLFDCICDNTWLMNYTIGTP